MNSHSVLQPKKEANELTAILVQISKTAKYKRKNS